MAVIKRQTSKEDAKPALVENHYCFQFAAEAHRCAAQGLQPATSFGVAHRLAAENEWSEGAPDMGYRGQPGQGYGQIWSRR